MSECNVGVYVRFRPVNARELAEGGTSTNAMTWGKTAVHVDAVGKPLEFAFDGVFDATVTQQRVYDECARDAIEDVLRLVFVVCQGLLWLML
jgi:kinesin family protein 5